MKLIIDIPEENYKFIKDLKFYCSGRRSGKTIERNVINGIKNGKPYEERPQDELNKIKEKLGLNDELGGKKMKVYDRFAEEFIDESEMDTIAPPERYVRMEERDYHLKDVMIFKGGVCVGHGLINEEWHLLFSGFITCEDAIKNGYYWSRGNEEADNGNS